MARGGRKINRVEYIDWQGRYCRRGNGRVEEKGWVVHDI